MYSQSNGFGSADIYALRRSTVIQKNDHYGDNYIEQEVLSIRKKGGNLIKKYDLKSGYG